MFKSILVLESVWDAKTVKSKSVFPFVKEFANVNELEAHHQTFTDNASLCHWINVFHKSKAKKPKLLYIASHGNTGSIGGLKRNINFSTIIDAVRKAKSIEYVHLGSCFVGKADNLDKMLRKAKHIKLAFGYNAAVSWIDSTMVDILLWQRVIEERDKKTRGKKSSSIVRDFIYEEIPGLAKDLKLECVYRRGKKLYDWGVVK